MKTEKTKGVLAFAVMLAAMLTGALFITSDNAAAQISSSGAIIVRPGVVDEAIVAKRPDSRPLFNPFFRPFFFDRDEFFGNEEFDFEKPFFFDREEFVERDERPFFKRDERDD